jgi:hypothetical protein
MNSNSEKPRILDEVVVKGPPCTVNKVIPLSKLKDFANLNDRKLEMLKKYTWIRN